MKNGKDYQLKKYIVSFKYGYIPFDDLNDIQYPEDALYYAEIINKDKEIIGNIKKCSFGSKAEQNYLRILMNLNKIEIFKK